MARAEISEKSILQQLRNAAAALGIRGSGKNFPYHINTEDVKVVIALGETGWTPFLNSGALISLAGASQQGNAVISPDETDDGPTIGAFNNIGKVCRIFGANLEVVFDAAGLAAVAGARISYGYRISQDTIGATVDAPLWFVQLITGDSLPAANLLTYHCPINSTVRGGGTTPNAPPFFLPASDTTTKGWKLRYNIELRGAAQNLINFPANTTLQTHVYGVWSPTGIVPPL